MKKKIISFALGLVFASVPTLVYATCADVITFGNQICALVGSSTTSTGVEVCSYRCTSTTTPAPAPEQPEN